MIKISVQEIDEICTGLIAVADHLDSLSKREFPK